MRCCDGIKFSHFLGPARGSRSTSSYVSFSIRGANEGRTNGEFEYVTQSLAHPPPLTCQGNVTDGGTKCQMCRQRDAAEEGDDEGETVECLPPDDRFITETLHTHTLMVYLSTYFQCINMAFNHRIVLAREWFPTTVSGNV